MARKPKETLEETTMPTETVVEAQAAPKAKSSRMAEIMSSELIKKINKASGGVMVRSAAEKAAKKVHKISTGIFDLDFALGGGYQVGMMHTVYGPQSGGKTSVLLRTIANAQKMCGNCWTEAPDEKCECKDYREVIAGYLDVEGTLDLEWAQRLGVDVDRMIISTPEYAEETLDIMDSLLRSGKFDIIVVDSLAFMSPKKEVEESNEKDMMGTQARALAKGIRKLVSSLNAMELKPEARRPTIFMTNQIRTQLGVMFGNPESVSGGKAPRYAAATEVRLAAGKYHFPGDKDENGEKSAEGEGVDLGRPDYVDFHFKVEKNKTSVPKIEGDYRMILAPVENKKLGDIWNESSMVSFAQKTGLLTGGGASWKYDDKTYKGKSGFEAALVHDEKLRKQLWDDLMKITAL
jgi:recombination protein RecA